MKFIFSESAFAICIAACLYLKVDDLYIAEVNVSDQGDRR